jgi:hypothetical protein
LDVAVGISEEGPLASGMVHPRRLVTLQPDDADFVVTFYPENLVVFRHAESNALRKVWASMEDHQRRLERERHDIVCLLMKGRACP